VNHVEEIWQESWSTKALDLNRIWRNLPVDESDYLYSFCNFCWSSSVTYRRFISERPWMKADWRCFKNQRPRPYMNFCTKCWQAFPIEELDEEQFRLFRAFSLRIYQIDKNDFGHLFDERYFVTCDLCGKETSSLNEFPVPFIHEMRLCSKCWNKNKKYGNKKIIFLVLTRLGIPDFFERLIGNPSVIFDDVKFEQDKCDLCNIEGAPFRKAFTNLPTIRRTTGKIIRFIFFIFDSYYMKFCEECWEKYDVSEMTEDELIKAFPIEESKNRLRKLRDLKELSKEVQLENLALFLQCLTDYNEEVRIEALVLMNDWPKEYLSDPQIRTQLFICLKDISTNVQEWAFYLTKPLFYDSIEQIIDSFPDEEKLNRALAFLSDDQKNIKLLIELWQEKNRLPVEDQCLRKILESSFWERCSKVLGIMATWPNEYIERVEVWKAILRVNKHEFDDSDDADKYHHLTFDLKTLIMGKWSKSFWLQSVLLEDSLALIQSSVENERLVGISLMDHWPKDYWNKYEIRSIIIKSFFDEDKEVRIYISESCDYIPKSFWLDSEVRKYLYSNLIEADCTRSDISLSLCLDFISDETFLRDTKKVLEYISNHKSLPNYENFFSLLFSHKYDYLQTTKLRNSVIEIIKTELPTPIELMTSMQIELWSCLKEFYTRLTEIREFMIQTFYTQSGSEDFTDIFLIVLFTKRDNIFFFEDCPELKSVLKDLIITKLKTRNTLFSADAFRFIKGWVSEKNPSPKDKVFLQRIIDYWPLKRFIEHAPEIVPLVIQKIEELLNRSDHWIFWTIIGVWPLDFAFQKFPSLKPFILKQLIQYLSNEGRESYLWRIMKETDENDLFFKELFTKSSTRIKINILETINHWSATYLSRYFSANKSNFKVVNSQTLAQDPTIQKLAREIIMKVKLNTI